MTPVSIEEEFAHSSTVFIGEVISVYQPINLAIEDTTQLDSLPFRVKVNFGYSIPPYQTITFRVRELFKGNAGKLITLKTGRWSTNCGIDFKEGKRYLVYADWQNEADFGNEPYLYTSRCYRTRLVNQTRQEQATLRTLKSKD